MSVRENVVHSMRQPVASSRLLAVQHQHGKHGMRKQSAEVQRRIVHFKPPYVLAAYCKVADDVGQIKVCSVNPHNGNATLMR